MSRPDITRWRIALELARPFGAGSLAAQLQTALAEITAPVRWSLFTDHERQLSLRGDHDAAKREQHEANGGGRGGGNGSSRRRLWRGKWSMRG
jgi:hypothetical protein